MRARGDGDVWRKAHLFDPAKASVATWIYTIARNRRIDLARRVRPEPEELPWGPEEEASAAETMVLQQETERLGQALRALPEKQKELIERAFFGELSHSEIAAQTGLPWARSNRGSGWRWIDCAMPWGRTTNVTKTGIRHHLSDAILMGYAAGSLPEAFNLVAATHISLCDECRARMMEFECWAARCWKIRPRLR